MHSYYNGAVLIRFLVDVLLLVGTNCLCAYPPGWVKCGGAALLGGVYSAVCMQKSFFFLNSQLWRFIFLGIVGWIAFGSHRSSIRRIAIYVLLTMALGGISQGINTGGAVSVIASAIMILVIYFIGFGDFSLGVKYVPVEVTYGGKQLSLVALKDTGNTLRDPVSGGSVLVVEADVAEKLTGLTPEQLRSPVKAMEQGLVPGLRLIPYRSVGQSAGLLLALRFPEVRIGKWKGSTLVAFAPEELCSDGRYQALTGGAA